MGEDVAGECLLIEAAYCADFGGSTLSLALSFLHYKPDRSRSSTKLPDLSFNVWKLRGYLIKR